MGVIRAWQFLAPLLLRPVPEIERMIGALGEAMLPGALSIGLHIRMGSNWHTFSNVS
jgi:hypothetical protein